MRASAHKRALAFVAAAVTVVATVGLASADPPSVLSHLTGELLVANGDTFAAGPTVVQVSLRTPSGVVPLRIPPALNPQLVALAGRQVEVSGTSANRSFDAFDLAPVATGGATAPDAGVAATARPMRIAVVLMHGAESANEDVTKQQVEAVFFGRRLTHPSRRHTPAPACPTPTPGSMSRSLPRWCLPTVAQWFSDISSGQVRVSGAVFGTYSSRLAANDCNLADWMTAAASAAGTDGYSAERFTDLVVYTPLRRCPFAAIGQVGSSGVYMNGHMLRSVAEHELGHNLGLWNAGAYSCSPPTPSCLDDYGDPTDAMGNAHFVHDYSAAHKYMLGWIPRSEAKTLTDGSQTVRLTAGSRPVITGSTELVFIPRKDGTKYAIERGSFGKSGGSGILVRIVAPVGTDDTALAVRTPLAPGQSFVDAVNGVTITTLSDSGRTASVQICLGPCGYGNPPPTTSASPMLVDWGGGAYLTYSDAQLAELVKVGVTGLVVGFGWLPSHGLGGTAAQWTAIPDDFSSRCRRAGITKLWASFEPADYNDPKTAFGDWFDDGEWTNKFLPSLTFVATTLKAKGWTGIAFDNEMYPGVNNQRPTWQWNFPGNTHTEAEVRAQARLRGQQIAGVFAAHFPGAELITYHDYFGDATNYGYHSLLEHTVNREPLNQYARNEVKVNFYDGLTSVPGALGRLTIGDASFYYGATLGRGMTMNDLEAMQFAANGTKAYLQRTLTNKAVNVFPEPMVLLGPSNGDGSPYTVEQAMTPDRALIVAQAARAASTGGIVINYCPGDVKNPAAVANFTGDVVNGVPRLKHADLRPAYLAAAGR